LDASVITSPPLDGAGVHPGGTIGNVAAEPPRRRMFGNGAATMVYQPLYRIAAVCAGGAGVAILGRSSGRPSGGRGDGGVVVIRVIETYLAQKARILTLAFFTYAAMC
jgi:hypothetical protein